ncbi:hypothetical protein E2C01_058471 [Portunus trituberculatus]|uniref:Uncharacterized protein n=1 Tax=Portunus trituberculatus TaxID=210409 RepID=A0A5B7H4S5_PORTR|nr:hypothetical protein [Portunus trituberculatus]
MRGRHRQPPGTAFWGLGDTSLPRRLMVQPLLAPKASRNINFHISVADSSQVQEAHDTCLALSLSLFSPTQTLQHTHTPSTSGLPRLSLRTSQLP